MSNEGSLSLPELSDRIAILQDNIRQLVEQAASRANATMSASPTASARRMKSSNG
jgi:uncharacterized small protein (DUF1192 family)